MAKGSMWEVALKVVGAVPATSSEVELDLQCTAWTGRDLIPDPIEAEEPVVGLPVDTGRRSLGWAMAIPMARG